MNWNLALTVLAVMLAAAQLIYAGLTYHQDRQAAMQPDPARQPRRPIAIIASFMVLTWAAVAMDFYDRSTRQSPQMAVIQSYGQLPGGFYTEVNTDPLMEYRENSKLLMIVRISYSDIDGMTDTAIEKSGAYTIVPHKLIMSAILQPKYKLRVSKTQSNAIQYYCVLIPSRLSPELIASLSDIERLGGKIVDQRGQIVPPMEIRANQDNPQDITGATQPSSK
jgi:hypothetical protein